MRKGAALGGCIQISDDYTQRESAPPSAIRGIRMQAVAPPFNAAHNNYNSGAGGNNNNSNNSGSGPICPSFFDLAHHDCCHKWNLSACREPCAGGRKHSCMWKACNDSSSHERIAKGSKRCARAVALSVQSLSEQ